MEYTFVLKDKGTSNQGWWLKLSNFEQLTDYLQKVNPNVYGNVFENYFHGKEFHSGANQHMPHMKEESLTRAVVMSAKDGQTIFQAINGFETMTALNKLEKIEKYGACFINRVGGCHADYDGEHKYDFVRRKELIFPTFKRDEIRIKQFTGGKHFYAYIDDVQVRDGEDLKWNTYDEASQKASMYLDIQTMRC